MTPSAVVVGGGFAGVTAARELAAAGFDTVLLEARERLGGRTWTTRFGDDLVELGGGWVHWQQPHMWSELTRHGIAITEDDWRHDAVIGGATPCRYDAEESFRRLRELFVRYAGEHRAILPRPYEPLLGGEALRAIDRLSMQDRLDQLDLSEEERGWLSGLLFEIAGSPLSDAGLTPVLRWMALCDWNIERWYDTNRYRPVGGTIAVIDAMLADGRVDVRLSSPVAAVDAGHDGVRVETVDGTSVQADVAVIAVPVNVWPTIAFAPALPAGHRAAAERGVGKPHQDKVWIRVRGDIGRVFGQLPAPAPLNFFWTYEYSGDTQLMIGINASPELDVRDGRQVAEVIRSYVPEIEAVTDVLGHRWDADPYARGGNGCFRPGQLTDHLAALQAPQGRLAFATSDIASGWMGYMDGAIESGIRAARHCRERVRGA